MTQMRFFRAPDGDVHGYDDTDDAWAELMQTQAIDAGWVEVTGAWPPAPTLDESKAAQIAALQASYQAAIRAPISFTTAAGAQAIFPQTDQAKGYLAQCISAGAAAWTLNLWLDASGTPVTPFSYADLQGLAAAMEAVEVPDYRQLLALIGAVQAATTIVAVQAITWTAPEQGAPA